MTEMFIEPSYDSLDAGRGGGSVRICRQTSGTLQEAGRLAHAPVRRRQERSLRDVLEDRAQSRIGRGRLAERIWLRNGLTGIALPFDGLVRDAFPE